MKNILFQNIKLKMYVVIRKLQYFMKNNECRYLDGLP